MMLYGFSMFNISPIERALLIMFGIWTSVCKGTVRKSFLCWPLETQSHFVTDITVQVLRQNIRLMIMKELMNRLTPASSYRFHSLERRAGWRAKGKKVLTTEWMSESQFVWWKVKFQRLIASDRPWQHPIFISRSLNLFAQHETVHECTLTTWRIAFFAFLFGSAVR